MKKVKGKIDLSASIVVDKKSDERERVISFVNSTPTFDGGFHVDRVRRLFINGMKAKLEKVAKREKVSIVDNDILTGMTFVVGVTMPNPRFESQTKRKLVRDNWLDKSIEHMQEALRILEMVLPLDHVDVVRTFDFLIKALVCHVCFLSCIV